MIVILGRVGAVKKSNIWTRTRTETLFALGTRQAMETEKKRKHGRTWKISVYVCVLVNDKQWP